MAEIREEQPEHIYSERPTPEYGNQMRPFGVEPLDYGFIINVGCQRVAVESKDDLIKYLTEYIKDPAKTEEKYYKSELLKHQTK